MELSLKKPIVFFDLETTGVAVAKDRIVEISVFKVYPNGNKESKTWLVNPTIPIPAETTAYKFYCAKDLENAHSAEADTQATYEILTAQLDRYQELENDIDFLSEFSQRGKPFADMAGFIVFNEDNEECFSFGKYKGQTVASVLQTNPGYFSWIQQADFPLYTKKVLTQIKLRDF
ncbi:MAG: hypothetical protein EBY39_05420 [Flavobacteriia bacterium]|nr:hypothetical protein [Flavobacteriia bacterium]